MGVKESNVAFSTHHISFSEGKETGSPGQSQNPPPVPSPEQDKIIKEVKDTKKEIPGVLLQEMVWNQALIRKDQPAIITSDRILSYREVYQKSNQWGRVLKNLGAGPNQLVAVVMEKGWEQIISVLAILNAGAAYLPLSPALPEERRNYLLTHSEVRIVLTQANIKEQIKNLEQIRYFSVDEEEGLSGIDDSPLARQQEPGDLANVIYTSGSTGLPKGVMIAQRGLVNCIAATNRNFNVGARDRVLALTALHHDMSAYDIFGILSAGGTMVMPEAGRVKDPAHWLQLIIHHKVTTWNSVPAMMEMLLEYLSSYPGLSLESLRLAFLGGDWIHLSIPPRLKKYADNVQVISVGGPTETTLWNIWYPVKTVEPGWKSIPYGKPIANTKYYILDRDLNECPPGAIGELCCAGIGLARGYWKDPQKTAESFITHPKTNERLFQTGDLGRYLPDGNIEFMGRNDFQVKIHGQRIELGEIENTLKQHRHIHDAVAVVKETPPGVKQLTVYYIPRQNKAPDSRILQEFLQDKLPPHMVPSFFYKIERFPLTSNGKVDRKLLLADGPFPESETQWRFIDEILEQHEYVKDAVTIARKNSSPGNDLITYVVPQPVDSPPEEEQKTAELVSQWQKIYDETYNQSGEYPDKSFNTTGWISSYTGEPIPAPQMREWVESTVKRILTLKPDRALEIGCGTGLLLFRLAPGCSRYDGTDFSGVVIDTLNNELSGEREKNAHISVSRKTAADFSGIENGRYDTVILNSVTQLFPGIEYLVNVLKGAVDVTEPGGTIFVGDLRALPLLEAFHTSVQCYQSPSFLAAGDLKLRIQKRLRQEKELLIDPAFFLKLPGYLPRISQVRVLLKPGRFHNELTRFRYDVFLHLDTPNPAAKESPGLNWRDRFSSVHDLIDYLTHQDAPLLKITDVPNARLLKEIERVHLLNAENRTGNVGQLQEDLDKACTAEGFEPEDFRELGEQAGWEVDTGWAGSKQLAHFDVIFSKKSPPKRKREANRRQTPVKQGPGDMDWTSYANHPAAYISSTHRLETLRHFLEKKIPEKWMPSQFVFIDALTYTAGGVIDYSALPVPDPHRAFLDSPFEIPGTATETKITAIWTQLLGIKAIGIHDDFFALGGHSLNAIQLITRLQAEFNRKIALKELYEFPTIAQLSEKIDTLQHKTETVKTFPPLLPDPDNRHLPFPLNDQQRAYWVGKSGGFEIGNVDCHVYFEVDCVNLNPDRFNNALNHMIHRHDALRTVILPDGQQKILKTVPPYHIPVLDLTGKNPSQKTRALNRIRKKLSHQVFKINSWPLVEVRVSKLDEIHSRVHASYDGIIIDGISHFILIEEFYRSYLNPGKTLPEIALSFRDYVLAAAKLRDTELYKESREYWLNRLATLPPAPELPRRINPQSLQQPKFVRWSLKLNRELTQRLRNRARRAGVTESAVLLTAFSEVIAAWSSSPTFSLNIPNFNRFNFHPQVNDLVGEFASFTLLPLDFSQPGTFENRANQIQRQLWKDLEYSYFSGVEILREYNKLYPHGNYLLIPIVFSSLLNLKDKENRISSKLNVVYHLTQTPQVWLDSIISEENGELLIDWDVVEALFPPGMIQAMFDAYGESLRRLSQDETAWLERTRDFLPARDREIRDKLNRNTMALPDGLIHDYFVRQVPLRKDQPAVISSTKTLTYGQLLKKSLQLGRLLRQLGAVPNQLIALVMERGWEQVLGVLGILFAGSAYLPLPADLPPERLKDLLTDSETRIVLTQSALKDRFAWPTNLQCLCLDDEDLLANQDDHPLENLQQQEDLVYVIYTSGSTGFPKGVKIDHRALVNIVFATNRRFKIGADDSILALTALYHDLSVYDIFGMLAAGGRIIIPHHTLEKDPNHWIQLIKTHRVTTWNSVPAMMEMLLESAKMYPGLSLDSLRLSILGGDWVPVSLPQRLRKISRNIQILCIGGPTETTIWNIWYPVARVHPHWKSIPYGKPIANNRYYILNQRLEDCPVWVTGTQYCAGIGLSRGYWKDDETTRQKFIIHPRTGERLYNTGDLGRYLPDGNIEFMGREDFQVKIHGQRIELGEIEKKLERHNAVQSAIVSVYEESDNKKYLMAFYLVKKEMETTEHELIYYLQSKLPAHMIPRSLIRLDRFPLSPTGKIDRGALRLYRPDIVTSPQNSVIEPRNPVERGLAQIIRDLLNLDKVGIYDDFLALGGSSFSAVKLITQIDDVYHARISIADIFVESNIDGFIAAIARALISREEFKITGQLLDLIGPLTEEEVERRLGNSDSPQLRDMTPSPTVYTTNTGVVERATQLSSQKKALLILLLKNYLDKLENLPPIPRRTQRHLAPLSPEQEGVWLFEEREPGSIRFNIPFTVYIKGNLNANILENVINRILQRHDILRTVLRVSHETPVQQIREKLTCKMNMMDLRSDSSQNREKRLEEIIRKDSHTSFDLSQIPLFRVSLIRLAEKLSLMILTMHHIICDEYSFGIFRDEMLSLYDAFSRKAPSPLPDLEIQYGDYAAWKKEWLKSAEYKRQLSYWQNQLAGNLDYVKLPMTEFTPYIKSHEGNYHYLDISPATLDSIKKLCRKENVTLFMFFLSALLTLLFRTGGQRDLTIATPLSGRQWTETQSLIGLFVNMIILRLDLTPETQFNELLADSRQTVSQAFAHQAIPFEQLFPSLRLDPGLKHLSAHVVFNFIGSPRKEAKSQEISITPGEYVKVMVSHNFGLFIEDRGDNLTAAFSYKTKAFTDKTIQQLGRYFETLINNVTRHPRQKIVDIPLVEISHQDREKLTDTLSDESQEEFNFGGKNGSNRTGR